MPARTPLALIATLAALALGACGGDGEPGDRAAANGTPEKAVEEPTDVTGGTTILELDDGLRTVLALAGVDVGGTGGARMGDGGIRIPVSAGKLDLDSLSGRVEHAGGLSFRIGDRTIEADELAVDATDGEVTAEIGGERVALFSLDFGEPRVPQTSDVAVLPARVGLAAGGVADRLNDALGVDVLRGDLPIGELLLEARRP